MEIKFSVSVFIILLITLNFQAQSLKQEKPLSEKVFIKTKLKKKKFPKVISLGVINGRAKNLVKPDFPLTAKAVNVRGAVNVSILINEEGGVIEAKAVSGHPLLQANSVSAALKSTFEPMIIGGSPVRVRGTVVYKYVSDNFNWLEIGNAFKEINFPEMLPFGFEEEKQMYEQYLTANYENKLPIYLILQAMIENKLISNEKNLWLFQAGILLKKFQANHPSEEDWKTDVTSLKIIISNSPENVAQALILRLKNLLDLAENLQINSYDFRYGSKIYQQIEDLKEKMSILGN